jgi:glycosyltransferase involved in cell wall biosynthesis
MRDKSLVSAVIIFLNAEQFIKEAIESVLAQTYDHWELFLVDDGSTDASTGIALQYAARYPKRVRYLEHQGHQNRGMSAARNLGISNAKGDYISFLDADDVWFSNKLEQQVAILESNPEAAMVYGPAEVWHSWTGHSAEVHRDFIQQLDIQPNQLIPPPTLVTVFLSNGSAAPSPSAVMIRADAIQKAGGFEELFWGGTQLYDDQAFYFKVGLEKPVFVSNQCWYKYRRHPDAHCVVAYKARQEHDARWAFLSWFKKHLTKHGVEDQHVWGALQKALRAKELQPYRHPLFYRLLQYSKRLAANFEYLVRAAVRWTIPLSVRLWLRGR